MSDNEEIGLQHVRIPIDPPAAEPNNALLYGEASFEPATSIMESDAETNFLFEDDAESFVDVGSTNIDTHASVLTLLKQLDDPDIFPSIDESFDSESLDPVEVRAFDHNKQTALTTGGVDSIYIVGCNYFFGTGTPKDDRKALYLWQYAASKGHVKATFNLGVCYQEGIGIEVNPRRAVELYQRAHEKGNANAACNLGYCYRKGIGVGVNHSRAAELYEQAHDSGNVDATYNLGVCYERGFGVEVNLQRSVELCLQAHEKGNLRATFNLGLCYEFGVGVEVNPQRAVELYKHAHEKDRVSATFNLGVCYENGIGVDVNPQQAVQLYQQAHANGYVNATFNLGRCYEKGIGIEGNPQQAVQLYQQAHEQGNMDAAMSLGYYGIGVDQDFSLAVKFTQIAADAQNLQATQNLLSFLSADKANIQTAIQYARNVLKLDCTRNETKCVLARCLLEESTSSENFSEAKSLLSSIPVSSGSYNEAQWLLCYIDDVWEDLSALATRCKDLPIDFILDYRVRLVAKIGEGHFGKVYLAHMDGRDQPWVAVKFLNVDLVQKRRDIIRNVQRERLAWRIVQQQTKISHVAEYIGFLDDDNGSCGMVFELCADISRIQFEAHRVVDAGLKPVRHQNIPAMPDWSKEVKSSLRSFVVHCSRGRPPVTKIVRMLANVARALEGLHQSGYIHRDIADRNVLCDVDLRVQLADLGLAKMVGLKSHANDSELTEPYKYAKALDRDHQYPIAWWAPECIGDGALPSIFSVESDVYAFGMLMWQCFAHRDPFEDVLENSKSSMDQDDGNIVADMIADLILNGVRPDVNQTDSDTPSDLLILIDRCWATDPNQRPSVQHIIDELDRIAKLPPKPSGAMKFSAATQQHKWFDIEKMYMNSPSKKARGQLKVPDGSSEYYMQKFKILGHLQAPSSQIPSDVIANLGSRPFDIFMAHAGPQKLEPVTSIAELLECYGFRCFVDKNLTPDGGAPTTQLQFALETCRYALVLVSKEFLRRKDPVNELIFSFLRMKWIRTHFGWESLRIILYDLTVDEFKSQWSKIVTTRGIEAEHDDIGDQHVIIEWNNVSVHWDSWLYKLKARMVDCDKESAIDRWRRFLCSDRSDFQSWNIGYSSAEKMKCNKEPSND